MIPQLLLTRIENLADLKKKGLTHEIYIVLDLLKRNESISISFPEADTEEKVIQAFNSFYNHWYDNKATEVEKSLIGYNFILDGYYPLSTLIMPHMDNLDHSLPLNKFLPLVLSSIKQDQFIKNHMQDIKLRYDKLIPNITCSLSESLSLYNKLTKIDFEEHMHRLGEFLDSIKVKKNKRRKGSTSIKKSTRRTLVRSLKLFEKIVGKKETKAFIRGQEFVIEGNKYNYVVKKSRNIVTYTERTNCRSIPYQLKLYNKKGVFLTECCIVFEHSPIIDQILSLYLFIKGGKEEELLTTSRFFCKSKDLKDDEYLTSLKEKPNIVNDCDYKYHKDDKLNKLIVRNVGYELLSLVGIPESICYYMLLENGLFNKLLDYNGNGLKLPINTVDNLLTCNYNYSD